MADLKSCPFCGGEAGVVRLRHWVLWRVECWSSLEECGAEGPTKGSEDAAIAAWNRRDTSAALERKVERLTEALAEIANADYRGNRSNLSIVAERALQETGE